MDEDVAVCWVKQWLKPLELLTHDVKEIRGTLIITMSLISRDILFLSSVISI